MQSSKLSFPSTLHRRQLTKWRAQSSQHPCTTNIIEQNSAERQSTQRAIELIVKHHEI